ncbi:hypothetical protein HW130_23100 [Streptomyces sp. PKU-EA00015]|uniref:hypothetical protein n=1 Tax=Streptomyces sp. PKU-EA00015 TaxID=2748326 RepID=UPI0015A24C68|nr:hypothetical protein [Streptomyces sp. PKU-EA00015]NWF29108.1 hypothetical protein [Streptomyces sp. PKU-EA00015]
MADDRTSGAPKHGALPLPDYDHLGLEAVKQRVRTLSQDGVRQLLAYEEAHANRLPVVQALQVRLEELESGAAPSGGSPAGLTPEQAPGPSGGTGVSPQTAGPPVNPPSHGTPQNPAQPR